jgi:hypothetical protein
MHPEATVVDYQNIAFKYFFTAIDLFVFLLVLKSAYLATIKPISISRFFYAVVSSAFISSQIVALSIHVIPYVVQLPNFNDDWARFIWFVIVFSGVDALVLTVMKWRTKRTTLGLLLINVLFAGSGLVQACLWQPIISTALVRLALWKHL